MITKKLEKKVEEKVEKSATKAGRIEQIKAKMEKDYGKGALMGAKDKPMLYECIPTGSIGLDLALGIGGLPRGRIVEIYGPESSGKTTLCLEILSKAHLIDKNAYCAIIDTEHSVDLKYAEQLGVDLNRLEISQPDYGEQALDIAEKVIESGEFDVVVIDSVAALVPKSELEGEMGDSSMGKQARLMSQALRKLVGIVSKSNTILIFTNQMRDKIGVMFGSPETTTGGNALKFYASIRLDIRRSVSAANTVKGEEGVKIGNQVKVKVVKNKVAPPFREAIFDILYGEGVDNFGEIVDMGVDYDIIKKSGSWFAYNENKLGQGREAVRQLLKDNPELYEEIKEKVLKSFKPKEFEATQNEIKDANI